jgi:hypothetical protein
MRWYKTRPKKPLATVGLIVALVMLFIGARNSLFVSAFGFIWLALMSAAALYLAANLFLPNGPWMPMLGFKWQRDLAKWEGYDVQSEDDDSSL